ncbi:MAG: dolichyl-phosphate-mannose--protein mannosyltransferase, partial [Clostridia bacterium]|nr:dolichyl-phosphate-mannose--protein mannosyltransferase [Clostridia bacterium]
MNFLTYIFPLAAIAFVLMLSYSWIPLLRRAPDTGEDPSAGPRLSFNSENGRMTGRDRWLALAITLVYAAVAFIGLGDTEAPQSFCYFADRGRYADIELPEETEIGAVMYYCGLHTGNYYLQFSDDGINYEDVSTMEQNYAALFKWKTAEFSDGAQATARYIRIISDDELSMGELALYGADGELLDSSGFTYNDGCAELFDEQALIPEIASYMNSTYFDEIYHARTALEHIEGVYPYEISHPPLGKIILSLGIRAFGMTPFGWRFMGTLFGILMLPILYIFLKNMFGDTSVSFCGTIIFAFHFMHFAQTRIATID